MPQLTVFFSKKFQFACEKINTNVFVYSASAFLLFHGDDSGVDGFLFSLHLLDVAQDLVHFICRDLHLFLTN